MAGRKCDERAYVACMRKVHVWMVTSNTKLRKFPILHSISDLVDAFPENIYCLC
jgi:hypothetical protein